MSLVPYLPSTVDPLVWHEMVTAVPSAMLPAELAEVLGLDRTVSAAPESVCTVPVAANAGLAPTTAIAAAIPATPATRFTIPIFMLPSSCFPVCDHSDRHRYKPRTNGGRTSGDTTNRTEPRRGEDSAGFRDV